MGVNDSMSSSISTTDSGCKDFIWILSKNARWIDYPFPSPRLIVLILTNRCCPFTELYAATYDVDILNTLSNLTHRHAHQLWSCDFLQKHTSEVVMARMVNAVTG